MTESIEYNFEMRPVDGEDGNDLNISIDLNGITISNDKGFRLSEIAYIVLTHEQFLELAQKVKMFDSARLSLKIFKNGEYDEN